MTHRIVWRGVARNDLLALYDWIATEAGAEIAFAYTAAIEERVRALSRFPDRGSPRDDLHPGLRTISHRRRTLIAYRIAGDQLEILRILHAGRELGQAFDEQ